jgi:hypothetical protein
MGNFVSNFKLLEQSIKTNIDNGILVEKLRRAKARKNPIKKIITETASAVVNPSAGLTRFILDRVHKIVTDK